MSGWWVASYVVLWVVVAALCVIVVALARQIGTLHLRMGPRGALDIDTEGPPMGEAAQVFETSDLSGEPTTIGGPGPPSLLLFVSPGCMVCEQVLPAVDAIASGRRMTAHVVTELDREEATLAFSDKRLKAGLVAGPEVFRAYEIPGTPFVVVLDDLGVVQAKGTPNNLEQMEGLVDAAAVRIDEAARARHVS